MIYDNGTIEVVDTLYRVYAHDDDEIHEDIDNIAEAMKTANELAKDGKKDIFIEGITVFMFSK